MFLVKVEPKTRRVSLEWSCPGPSSPPAPAALLLGAGLPLSGAAAAALASTQAAGLADPLTPFRKVEDPTMRTPSQPARLSAAASAAPLALSGHNDPALILKELHVTTPASACTNPASLAAHPALPLSPENLAALEPLLAVAGVQTLVLGGTLLVLGSGPALTNPALLAPRSTVVARAGKLAAQGRELPLGFRPLLLRSTTPALALGALPAGLSELPLPDTAAGGALADALGGRSNLFAADERLVLPGGLIPEGFELVLVVSTDLGLTTGRHLPGLEPLVCVLAALPLLNGPLGHGAAPLDGLGDLSDPAALPQDSELNTPASAEKDPAMNTLAPDLLARALATLGNLYLEGLLPDRRSGALARRGNLDDRRGRVLDRRLQALDRRAGLAQPLTDAALPGADLAQGLADLDRRLADLAALEARLAGLLTDVALVLENPSRPGVSLAELLSELALLLSRLTTLRAELAMLRASLAVLGAGLSGRGPAPSQPLAALTGGAINLKVQLSVEVTPVLAPAGLPEAQLSKDGVTPSSRVGPIGSNPTRTGRGTDGGLSNNSGEPAGADHGVPGDRRRGRGRAGTLPAEGSPAVPAAASAGGALGGGAAAPGTLLSPLAAKGRKAALLALNGRH